MAVEDSDRIPDYAGSRVDRHFARKMSDDSHVVVAEDQLDAETFAEKSCEEVEHHRPERGRGPHDRMLRVAGDHDVLSSRSPRDPDQLLGERRGRSFERSARSFRACTQAEMHVGNHQRPRPAPSMGFDQEPRDVRYGNERGVHVGSLRRTKPRE
jgi:hypothetical protein